MTPVVAADIGCDAVHTGTLKRLPETGRASILVAGSSLKTENSPDAKAATRESTGRHRAGSAIRQFRKWRGASILARQQRRDAPHRDATVGAFGTIGRNF
jgi:hypothetical protein